MLLERPNDHAEAATFRVIDTAPETSECEALCPIASCERRSGILVRSPVLLAFPCEGMTIAGFSTKTEARFCS